jgi:hypothetical protein
MQAEIEVARLDALKASKMKELVVKRRMELEEVCRFAHIEPDASTMEDKLIALIDSGDLELPCLSQGFSITVLFFSYCICWMPWKCKLNQCYCYRRSRPIRPSEQFGRADNPSQARSIQEEGDP